MPPSDLDQLSLRLLDVAAQAAFKVEALLLEGFSTHVATEKKSNRHDLVTAYDRNSEAIIKEFIFKKYPDSAFLGEESGNEGDGAIQWFVDPIDGTTNFAAGIPFFNVSIGAALGQKMLAGVVYDPIRREMFSASTAGAFLNAKPIRAIGNTSEANAVLLTDFPYPDYAITEDDYALFADMVRRFRSVRRIGSAALELAYVACGRVDAAFLGLGSAWDVAAGLMLIDQAGGCYLPIERLATGMWPPSRCVATCAGFDIEKSVLNTFFE
ncbi:MAG: inositol monophosphatase [Anaerolineae bacterium]|nr:inositol monophosphatase [Anaerolineae bacterium]